MGEDIVITFETLYDLLRREKNKEELQKLEPTYFQDVITYLEEKQEVLQSKSDVDDLFTMGEREKIETEIKNIRKIIADIYERREKKIMDMALNKSKTATNLIDTSTLLAEEKHLFDMVVGTLNLSRQTILTPLLRAKLPTLPGDQLATNSLPNAPDEISTKKSAPTLPNVPEQSSTTLSKELQTETEQEGVEEGGEGNDEEVSNLDTTQPEVTLTILHPVPQFLGENLEKHGPFNKGDIVTLPVRIASILVDKQRASIVEEQPLLQE